MQDINKEKDISFCGRESTTIPIKSLKGWIASKRNHGGLLFIDLRYCQSTIQCVVSQNSPNFQICDEIPVESVVEVKGITQSRPPESIKEEEYGDIEILIEDIKILSKCRTLPFALSQPNLPEDLRLKYRFLDLRRPSMQRKIRLRAEVIKTIRNSMENMGFIEIQTPILTSASPEGARDYVVPSRLHPGEFYALPQAPQQFKQLLMASGFEKYYQIAPCFRDEDPRADRLLGAFYQLDMEMSFATQEDVFEVIESVLKDIFTKFTDTKNIDFPRISYTEAMSKYATDKPDLRNPLEFIDVYEDLVEDTPNIFKDIIRKKGKVSLLNCPQMTCMSRKFFDDLNKLGMSMGLSGVGHIIHENNEYKGTLAKIIPESIKKKINGAAIILSHSDHKVFYRAASHIRTKIAEELSLIDPSIYKFCWIVDFPMYEMNDQGGIDFSHNPFSMPQGGMGALCSQNPLDILAYQYDIVCNGYELSSGAVRNHEPDIMYKAFEIAGYSKKEVYEKFSAMIEAFGYGTPPHAGCAPGIDRLVMLLAKEPNVREVIAFPLSQSGRDLLMNSPTKLPEERLHELHIQLKDNCAKSKE